MSASGFEFDQVEDEEELELFVDPLSPEPRLVLCNPSTDDEWIEADAEACVFLEEMR